MTATCQSALRDIDVLGRLGGEEFAVLLPETDLGLALTVAERLRAAVARAPLPLEDGGSVQLSASFGVASMLGADDNLDALLGRADRALYAAKGSGRNAVRS